MTRLTGGLALALIVALTGACADQDFFEDPDGGAGWEWGTGPCQPGSKQCSGNAVQICEGGKYKHLKNCNSPKICSTSLGDCADCEPALHKCVGDAVHDCNSKGMVGAKIKTCPAGTCSSGQCVDPCAQAKESKSYIGCTYWPTVTANAGLVEDFEFAVAVANASAGAANVTVASQSNPTLASVTVAAKSVATIKLPWIPGLKLKANTFISVQQPAGAYKLTSTRPVTVYQFNALDYKLNHDCKKGTDQIPYDNKCFSYSNDASLLLPEHALGTEYMVLARPTMVLKRAGQTLKSPGFFSVVATRPGTTKLSVKFSANTLAGNAGIKAYKKGETAAFALKQWEVLQILSETPTNCSAGAPDKNGYSYCDLSNTADLTGTTLKADAAIAVYAGHNCTFVPYDKWACDHLEEAIFPTSAMGKRYIGSHTTSSGKDPSLYRVVSASGENIISFDPAVHPTKKLGGGEWFEFLSTRDFEVKGSGRFALVKFMVGQNYSNTTAGAGAPNDPAMALAVPVEQYRTSYYFLAPASYEKNYVNIHAPSTANVTLDGTAIPANQFQQVNATSGMKVAKVQINGGSHFIQSTSKTGITVYGVGSYTSYMYPGGLDLKSLK